MTFDLLNAAKVLTDFEGWLRREAAYMLPDGTRSREHDDLVQEGRIAMWRALKTFDPDKGALPSWVTRAARTRMRDVAHGHGKPTGHEPNRGSAEAVPSVWIDALGDEARNAVDEILSFWDRPADPVTEKVKQAVAGLGDEKAREYVWLRFWAGLDVNSRSPRIREVVSRHPVLKERWRWQRAQQQLREDPAIQEAARILL
jgi:RNA polymerase sigma factor (sigma-70 family)